MATGLMAEIASRWLAEGTAMALVRWQREALAKRNQIAARVLSGHPITATPNGLHVWFPLQAPWDEGAFVALARHRGVAIAGGSAFAHGDQTLHSGVRICLGGVDEADLERGLEVIAQLAESAPEPAHLVF